MNDKTELKENKISYKKYYKLMGILSTFGGALWIFYGLADKQLLNIEKGQDLINIIKCVLSLGILLAIILCSTKMLVISAKRDKEDEMFQQTKAKINSAFISLLIYVGCAVFIISPFIDNMKITLNGNLATGFVWVLFALYNFIGLYYENRFDDLDEGEE